MEKAIDLDVKRIQALTDATFAVAITITILGINVIPGLKHDDLVDFIFYEIIPALFIYFISFIILGAFWIDSHFHHHLIIKTDRISSWLNVFFLLFICIIPFSSSFLIKYRHHELSNFFYCVNLLIVSLLHLIMLMYTWRNKYIRPHISVLVYKNMKIRILIPILTYCLLIPLAFYISEWIRFLFLAPLFFQIFFGRSKREFIPPEKKI